MKIKKNDTDDGRTYEIEFENGEVRSLISVTTVINTILAKPALVPWAFNLGVENTHKLIARDAQRMIKEDRIEEYVLALAQDPSIMAKMTKDRLVVNEMTTKDFSSQSADRGTLVHEYLEKKIKGQATVGMRDETEMYTSQVNRFIEEYGVEFHASEMTVFSLDKEYAGTLDAICTITKHPKRRRHTPMIGRTVVLDLKTNKNGQVYKNIQFPQLTAYEVALGEMRSQGFIVDEIPAVEGSMIVAAGPDKYGIGVNNYPANSFDCIHEVFKMYESMKK